MQPSFKSCTAFIGIFLMSCTASDDKNNCAQKMCTMEFRSYNVVLRTPKGEPFIADRIASYTTSGKLLHQLDYDSTYPEYHYLVLTDQHKGDLLMNKANDIDLKIFKDGSLKKTQIFQFTADCCHINKLSGPDTVVVD